MKFLGLPIYLYFVDDDFFDGFHDWTLPTRLFSQMEFRWDYYYWYLGYDIFGIPK